MNNLLCVLSPWILLPIFIGNVILKLFFLTNSHKVLQNHMRPKLRALCIN